MSEIGRNWRRILGVILLILLIGLAVFGLIFAFTMFVSVGVGHVVILVNPWAKTVSEPILGPTWVVKAPWVGPVDIPVAVDTLGMWGDGTDKYADFPTVACFSRDQLEMQIDIMLRWRLDVSKVRQLYQNLPQKNWKNDIIASIAREEIRLITKEFTTIQTIEQREFVAQKIRDAIWDKIKTSSSLANSLVDFEFELRNIGYPEKYTSAIEDKVVAEQAKIQAEFEKARIIILANATAQQVVIQATADAEAKVIEATATKEAIELILASVGQPENATRLAELYLVVQTLQRIAPYIDILIMTPEGIPILIPAPT